MSTTLETTKKYFEKKLGKELENSELLTTIEREIETSLKCALKNNLFDEEEIITFKANYLFYNKIYEKIKKELEV